MKSTLVKESDAPQPPKQASKIAIEVMEVLDSIKPGNVARVEPDEGQTLRGLKVSFGRVASNKGIKVQSWDSPEGDAIFVKKL
jgi:hypothetical protein